MTTIDNVSLALQAVRLLSNLRRDVRANAQAYKDDLDRGGRTVEQIASVSANNSEAYLRLLQRLKAVVDDADRSAMLYDGLDRVGVPRAEMREDWKELRDAAVAERDANKDTREDIETMVDWVLANVSEPVRLW